MITHMPCSLCGGLNQCFGIMELPLADITSHILVAFLHHCTLLSHLYNRGLAISFTVFEVEHLHGGQVGMC